MGLAIIMGGMTAFNILIILRKIELKRFQDAFFDAGFLVLLALVFGSTLGGMMVATIASAVISLYFLFNEPNFLPDFSSTKDSKETININDLYKEFGFTPTTQKDIL